MVRRHIRPIFLIVLVVGACRQQQSASPDSFEQTQRATRPSAGPEALSLLGRPLHAPELTEESRLKREGDLLRTQADHDADPHDENAIIWLGRRTAYLGRYWDAIDTFSNGLAIHPDSHRLLRHRGHRYITVRRFDLAMADLQRAAVLIRGIPDEVEPDGAPNRLDIPTSTSHTNIHYHLGLAKYLSGDFDGAADSYQQCLAFSKNDDMRVATLYWLYLSQHRAGELEKARSTLEQVTPDMTVIENHSYLLLLRLYHGEIRTASLETPSGSDSDVTIDRATIGYGLAVSDLMRGDRAAAESSFNRIVNDPALNWAAFGYIAAEAELARMRATTKRAD